MSGYYTTGSTSDYTARWQLKRTRSIKSEEELQLSGPLDIVGSVTSGRGIGFEGKFAVRGSIDAYGDIKTKGDMVCE